MILSHEATTTVLLLWSYVFIYNLALFVLFTTLFQLSLTNLKTLYSLTHFKGTHVSTKLLIISLLSMAGIPPFVGFFSKLFILILLLNSNFVLLAFFFFILLLTSLYFYIQNIRFLNASSSSHLPFSIGINLRSTTSFFYLVYPIFFFILFGFFFIDDLFLAFAWILY